MINKVFADMIFYTYLLDKYPHTLRIYEKFFLKINGNSRRCLDHLFNYLNSQINIKNDFVKLCKYVYINLTIFCVYVYIYLLSIWL